MWSKETIHHIWSYRIHGRMWEMARDIGKGNVLKLYSYCKWSQCRHSIPNWDSFPISTRQFYSSHSARGLAVLSPHSLFRPCEQLVKTVLLIARTRSLGYSNDFGRFLERESWNHRWANWYWHLKNVWNSTQILQEKKGYWMEREAHSAIFRPAKKCATWASVACHGRPRARHITSSETEHERSLNGYSLLIYQKPRYIIIHNRKSANFPREDRDI